ncbi:hypothetical protein AAG906_037055 [Vitis piasezkii]
MLTTDRATCIVFSVDDLPPKGSDHTLPFYIFVGCSEHRVLSILWENGSALNVCPLAIAVALGFGPLDFESSSQTISPVTFSALFQVLRIPTSFNLLLGRPWIHRARAIPSSLHQKVKFIHEGKVITIHYAGDTYSNSKPVLEISHGDDDLFLTGFTFDEIQTKEVEQFSRDHVVFPFDEHGSTVVLDMMRFMSLLPGLGLRRCQHDSTEFIAVVDHDTPFGLGFVPTEADYRYMTLLCKERLRAHLLHMPFDYPIRPYRMSLADYFVRAPEAQMHSKRITNGLSVDQETELQCLVRQLQLSDGASGTSTSILVTPPSPDHTSLLTIYFPDETDKYGITIKISGMIDGFIRHDEYSNEMLAVDMSQIIDDVQPETVSPLDLFRVLAIEMVEDVRLVPAPGLFTIISHDDDVVEGVTSPVVVDSKHVDPSLSFDILSEFVSRFDDVQTLSSYMDMSLFKYFSISCDITLSAPHSPTSQIFDIDDEIVQHDSDEDSSSTSDSSPNAEIVDFGTVYQPRELRIRLDLSIDERDSLKQLSVGFLSVVEYLEWLANVVHVPKKDENNARVTYQRAATTLFHDMMHQDVQVYVDNMIFRLRLNPKKCTFRVTSGKLLGYMVSEKGIEVDPDYIRAILNMYAPRTEREIKEDQGVVFVTSSFGASYTRSSLTPILVSLRHSLGIGSIVADHLASLSVSDGRVIDDDFQDEDITTVTSLSGWRMYFDGAANHSGYEIGVLLISPHGDHIPRSIRLGFFDRHPATNNIVEYEACILRLEIALELGIRQIVVFGDSNMTRDAKLRPYHAYLELLVRRFDDLIYTHLPRSRFVTAYCFLIDKAYLDDGLPWYHDIYYHQFVICGETLYRRSADGMLILCLDRTSADRVMREVHAGVCGPHMGGHMLAHKIMRIGYFWLTMDTDCLWGIDIIGKISLKSSNGHEFILVAIDYFTKWVEAASYRSSLLHCGLTVLFFAPLQEPYPTPWCMVWRSCYQLR